MEKVFHGRAHLLNYIQNEWNNTARELVNTSHVKSIITYNITLQPPQLAQQSILCARKRRIIIARTSPLPIMLLNASYKAGAATKQLCRQPRPRSPSRSLLLTMRLLKLFIIFLLIMANVLPLQILHITQHLICADALFSFSV